MGHPMCDGCIRGDYVRSVDRRIVRGVGRRPLFAFAGQGLVSLFVMCLYGAAVLFFIPAGLMVLLAAKIEEKR